MKTWYFNYELLDELVLSQRSATAGSHRSLDYLPGTAFLGAVADRLYRQLSPEDAFTVFHSGQVRFCNALPVKGKQLARPMPLSFHERKDDPATPAQLESEKVFNFIHPAAQEKCRENGKQPRQLRTGWLLENGQIIKPRRAYRMKTAINPETGIAAEGQLFGYQSLQPGECFQGEVQCDDSVSADLCEKILQALGGTLRLGRSRSAQYGRVQSRIAEARPQDKTPDQRKKIVCWLQSDLACSRDGVPLLAPQPAELGLASEGRLLIGESFIRTRRYTPYNSYRRLPDMERQVIVAGSVLSYEFPHGFSLEDEARCRAGLGEYREGGLGQVLVNPALFSGTHPVFSGAYLPETAETVERPDHPLVNWLDSRAAASDQEGKLNRWLENKVRDWVARQESARRFAGLAHFIDAGPSPTQWGNVQEKAMHNAPASLFGLLFSAEDCLCRGAEDWERPIGSGWGEDSNLRNWLQNSLNETTQEVRNNIPHAAARLAAAIHKRLNDGTWEKLLDARKE